MSERTQLMRSHPDVVGTFMQLTVPILIDVYAASVNLSLRTKTPAEVQKEEVAVCIRA